MNELLEKLAAVSAKIANLSALGDKMTDEDVEALEGLNKDAAKLKARIEAEKNTEAFQKSEAERIEREKKEAVEAALKAQADQFRVENNRLPRAAPYQAQYSDTWKYDNMETADLALLMDVQKTFAAKGVNYVDGSSITVPQAAYKALAFRVAEMSNKSNTERERQEIEYVKSAFKAGTRGHVDPTKEAIEAALKTSGDPVYTGGSLTGSDWVGSAYATQIWAAIRAATRVIANIPEIVIPDGYSNTTVPLESTDMTWYKVAEASAGSATLHVPAATVTSSQLATASKNITVGKGGARGVYTGEMTEDSLVRFVPQLREQLQMSGAEIMEHIAIDGDTEYSANKNINAIDTDPGTAQIYQIADGFRKLALVTNTANSRSAAGSLSVEDYKATLLLMGTAGLAGADPSKVAFIVDPNVHYANMSLPEVKTVDVAGASAATVQNGFLTGVYGVGIIPSWQMHRASATRKANTAGKVDADTAGNNTTGSIVCVRWDQWRQAYKRRMTLETTRIANADAWEIVALFRWGLAYRDSEASAITYNVGV